MVLWSLRQKRSTPSHSFAERLDACFLVFAGDGFGEVYVSCLLAQFSWLALAGRLWVEISD